jgi:uncharacterized RDD family membrane protein YckC
VKCPKCGYLGFEHVERCRNCGYDFLLSPAMADPELALRSAAGPSETDFALSDIALGASAVTELPFLEGDEPLITRPSPPRPPLAVRRATPEGARLRGQPTPTSLDLGFDTRPDPPRAVATPPVDGPEPAAFDASALLAAGVGRRIGAALLDLAILAIVDLAVVYFTLQICGIALAELALVPAGPLAAFLLVQNLGYLVAFNAGGQTLGKMATGIRVVPTNDVSGLDVGHALLRTLVWVVLAVPVGLGFLTALLGHDHRGLHDRFAGTRVVRA